VLESVVNISEGQNSFLLDELTKSLGSDFLDLHSDPDHHRSVFTMIGTNAPRTLSEGVVDALSLTDHVGVHPRLGVVDVVPLHATSKILARLASYGGRGQLIMILDPPTFD